jgi:hypothetical protein
MWQYTVCEAIYPEWDVFNAIISGTAFGDIGFYGWPFNHGMNSDFDGSLPAPVVGEGDKPSGTSFYEKGASINRMFKLHIDSFADPADGYFNTLGHHLQNHKYSNPMLPDLLDSFQTYLPATLKDIPHHMSQWLLQAGMPLLTITLQADTFEVQQRPSAAKIDQSQLWWVPLGVQFTCGTATSIVQVETNKSEAVFKLPSSVSEHNGPACFVQGNYNFTAFVLVNYTDPAQWTHITEQMAAPGFPAINRQQLQKQLGYLSKLENSHGAGGASEQHLVQLAERYTERIVAPWSLARANGSDDGAADVRELVQAVLQDYRQFRAGSGAAAAVSRMLQHVQLGACASPSEQTLSVCALALLGQVYFGVDANQAGAWQDYTTFAQSHGFQQFGSIAALHAEVESF